MGPGDNAPPQPELEASVDNVMVGCSSEIGAEGRISSQYFHHSISAMAFAFKTMLCFHEKAVLRAEQNCSC